MAKLNIPEKYQMGLSKIRSLDEQDVLTLRAALDTPIKDREHSEVIPEPDSYQSAVETVKSDSKQLSSSDLRQVARAILKLYDVRIARDDSSPEEFVTSILDAMEVLPNEQLRLPHSERETFGKKLAILLGSEPYSLSSKAHDLATEDERVFCYARIVTDLRPVFGHSIENGPKAMVLTHMLKLAFHQGSEKHQHFYVSLDADDLETLKRLITRAEAKDKSLRSAMKDFLIMGAPQEEK